MIHSVDLSEETWTLIDLYREGTGLGRSAAIEVLVGCALTQGLVMPQAKSLPELIAELDPFPEEELSHLVVDDVSGPEADAPGGGEEATGSLTPASSDDSSEHSPDV